LNFGIGLPTAQKFSSANPFLPAETFKKSSFLFGGDSDFQTAEALDSEEVGNVLYIDDDCEDESSSEEQRSGVRAAAKQPEHIFGSGLGVEDNKESLRHLLFKSLSTENEFSKPKPVSEPKKVSEIVKNEPNKEQDKQVRIIYKLY